MTFATELDLRNECQCFDPARISSESITRALTQAHQRILDETTLTDTSTATPVVVQAEVFLALSIVMRQEEMRTRLNSHVIRLQSLRFDDTELPERIHQLTTRLDNEAWGLLRPWWKRQPPSAVHLATGDAS